MANENELLQGQVNIFDVIIDFEVMELQKKRIKFIVPDCKGYCEMCNKDKCGWVKEN